MKAIANYLVLAELMLFASLLLLIFSPNLTFIAIVLIFITIGILLFFYFVFSRSVKVLKKQRIISRDLNEEEKGRYTNLYKEISKDSKAFILEDKKIGEVIIIKYEGKPVAVPNIIKKESIQEIKHYLLTLSILKKKNIYLKIKKAKLPMFQDIIIQEKPKIYFIPYLDSIKKHVAKRMQKEMVFLIRKEIKKGYDVAQIKSKKNQIIPSALREVNELSLLKLCFEISFLWEGKRKTESEKEYKSFIEDISRSAFEEAINKFKSS